MRHRFIAIFVSIALGACNCLGASVNWGAMDVQSSGTPYSVGSTEYSAYLYIVSSSVTYEKVIGYLNSGDVATAQTLASASRSATAIDADGVAKMHFATIPYDGGFVIGSTVSGFMIIVDDDTMADADNYLVALSSGTAVSSVTIPEYTTASLGWGFQTSNTAWKEIGAIPEPFSGALMLIGLAGVGLKRKFRKQKKA